MMIWRKKSYKEVVETTGHRSGMSYTAALDVLAEVKKLMEPEGQDDKPTAPAVDIAEVLYVDPAPGGEPRNCKNCVMWGSDTNQCSLMPPNVEATADHVCGYHVFGNPSKKKIQFDGIHPVNQKNSGFIVVKGGSSCQTCNWFSKEDEEDGVCLAVNKRKKRAHVHPLGCCTRWKTKQVVTDPKDS
jgi:hypothetical protein